LPSQGELYIVLTNKEAKGKKGALLAMVKGTVSEQVVSILEQMPNRLRKKVKEVTLDLAPTMERIARRAFPNAKLVSDRFHVQQLAGMPFSSFALNIDGKLSSRRTRRWNWPENWEQLYPPDIGER